MERARPTSQPSTLTHGLEVGLGSRDMDSALPHRRLTDSGMMFSFEVRHDVK
jgi:hypothetical protein